MPGRLALRAPAYSQRPAPAVRACTSLARACLFAVPAHARPGHGPSHARAHPLSVVSARARSI
eukprot:613698-Alexandrium_andersonii.AAC.1